MKQIEIRAASQVGIGGGVNGTGRRSVVRGFLVIRKFDDGSERAVRAFEGGDRKWTPALENELRSAAEAWAQTLRTASWYR